MIRAALLLAALASAAPAPTAKLVSIKTNDGWTLAADWRAPKKGGVVVILAHGVASSKGEWPKLSEKLQAAGVGTLALDLRGHHDSLKGPKGAGDWKTFDARGEWPKAVEDLFAAARWLKDRGVPTKRIAFGGASIGANLASQAAARTNDAPFVVLLSPGPDYRGVPLTVRPGLKMFAAASAGDGFAFQTLAPLKANGATTLEAPSGHGTQMFEDATTLNAVTDWIVAASSAPAR
jgi:alpha-beta hydrolase superfamily lysophospholipase